MQAVVEVCHGSRTAVRRRGFWLAKGFNSALQTAALLA
jgi:hypothetical protein